MKILKVIILCNILLIDFLPVSAMLRRSLLQPHGAVPWGANRNVPDRSVSSSPARPVGPSNVFARANSLNQQSVNSNAVGKQSQSMISDQGFGDSNLPEQNSQTPSSNVLVRANSLNQQKNSGQLPAAQGRAKSVNFKGNTLENVDFDLNLTESSAPESFSTTQTPLVGKSSRVQGLQKSLSNRKNSASGVFDSSNDLLLEEMQHSPSSSVSFSPPKGTRAPSTKMPAKKSILNISSVDDIETLVRESNEIGDMTRFAKNLGIEDVFDSNAGFLSYKIPDKEARTKYVENIITNYVNTNSDKGLFDPLMKLKQDINALKNKQQQDPFNQLKYGTNLTLAIGLADEAYTKMLKSFESGDFIASETVRLFEVLSPSEDTPIYSIVAQVDRSLDAIKRTIQILPYNSIERKIAEQYEKIYTDVHDNLRSVQNEVLKFENSDSRASLHQPDQSFEQPKLNIEERQKSSNDYVKRLEPLVLTKDQFNQRVKAQIDLDIEAQNKADVRRKLLEEQKNEKFSLNMNKHTPEDLIASALDDLIQELGGEKSAIGKKLVKIKHMKPFKASGEFDADEIEAALEKLVKDEGESTLDLSDFLNKTESLQVYTGIIKKLSSKIKSQQEKNRLQTAMNQESSSYVENFTDGLVNDIDSHFTPEEKKKYEALPYGSQEHITMSLNKQIAVIEKNIKVIEDQLADSEKQEFSVDTEIEQINKQKGFNPSTKQYSREFYDEVLKKLKIKKENIINLQEFQQNAKILAKKLMDIYKNDEKQDPIVIALEELIEKSNKDKKLEAILNSYKNSKKSIQDIKVVQSSLKDLSERIIEDFDENYKPYSSSPIISYSTLINDISKSMDRYKQTQDFIAEHSDALHQKITTGGWTVKQKIDTAIEALRNIKNIDTDKQKLKKVIEKFNEDLEYQIPEETSLEVFEGTLKKLQEESKLAVEQKFSYRALNAANSYIVQPISDFFASAGESKSSQASLSAVDQAAMSAAAKNVIDVSARPGATAVEVEGALHSAARVFATATAIVGSTIGLYLESPEVRRIISVAAPMFLQIQSSNLSQQQKDNQNRDLLSYAFQDILNAAIAEQTGADLATIQAGDAQAIGTSAALNYAINALDPNAKKLYQYNNSAPGDSMANINKWKTDTLAYVPPATQQNSYGSNYSGTGSSPYSSSSSSYPSVKPEKLYPSLEDLAQMENEMKSSAYTPTVAAGGYASPSLPELSTLSSSVPVTNWPSYPSKVRSSSLPYTPQANLQGSPLATSSQVVTGSYQDILAQIRKDSQSPAENQEISGFGG